jgi:hypothetical protein
VAGERATWRPVTRLGGVVTEPVEAKTEVAHLHHPCGTFLGGAGEDFGGPVLVTVPVPGAQQLHDPRDSPSP